MFSKNSSHLCVFTFLLPLLCIFSLPQTSLATPVLEADQSSVSMEVLGSYGDFSTIKKQNVTYALVSAKNHVAKNLSAASALVLDAVSGETIFAKDPDTQRQPASTIKILTGMIALKSLKNSDSIAVSANAARQPSSKIYLDQRKEYPAGDLINAVLLSSANDAGVALAEKIAGSEQVFAKMMTLRARLWGAKMTVCKTATGLTAKGQHSTARDLAIIFNHAMKDIDFAERMKHTKARTTEGKLLRNHNKALWQIDGAIGGKTGYTSAARQTYVGKFKRGKTEIVVAILGSERMWDDLKLLAEYGFQTKQLIAEQQLEGSRMADAAP